MKFTELLELSQTRVEKNLETYLIHSPDPVAPELQKAMAYSALNGGKRLRPLLVYATGLMFEGELVNLDIAACAVELIHTYSLIHDDLPSMDNANIRRGKATCHKAFDEATAILAGDALQAFAFEIIASQPAPLNSDQRLKMIAHLSKACGANGMVGGQILDLAGTSTLNDMYELKTGALLIASVKLGAYAANVTDEQLLNSLENYASNLGLAFQIQDDLLDFEHSQVTGKPTGIDSTNKKITYPSLIGIEKTHIHIRNLFAEAKKALNFLGNKATLLHNVLLHLADRKV